MPIRFMRAPVGVVAMAVLVAGCASVPRDAGFSEVEAHVADRAGLTVADRPDEALLAERAEALLGDGLAASEAVQLALLANPGIQAEFASLGIARADLLQAGLLKNPVVETHIGYALENDHAPDLGFGVSLDVLDLLYRPLRRAVAASAFEETRLRVAGAVLTLAGRVRIAYYDLQAAEAHVGLRRQVALAASASLDVAGRLREAGNIPEVELHAEQLAREQAQTDLAAAESDRLMRRERLHALLAVAREDWSIDDRLPDPEPLPADGDAYDKAVLAASLALATGRQEIETLGRRLRATNASALVPALSVGAEAVREGEWEAGPAVALPVPVFDRGQARKAMAATQLRRRQARYLEQAADVRAEARIARETLRLAHETATRYRQTILPLATRVTAETQQLYNAMQIGVFQLLDTRRPTPAKHVDRDYILLFNVLTINARCFPGTETLLARRGERVRLRIGNLSAMHHHPIHFHGHFLTLTGTDGGPIPPSARFPETTVLVPVGTTRDVEFDAETPGDWALHCHMTHHVMNQMGHGLPNLIGAKVDGLNEAISPLLPGYMTMGDTGMADHGEHLEHGHMPAPENSIAMRGASGPFGYVAMGGMFTLVKIREELPAGGRDPGWYEHPAGTVAALADEAAMRRDGIPL